MSMQNLINVQIIQREILLQVEKIRWRRDVFMMCSFPSFHVFYWYTTADVEVWFYCLSFRRKL